MPTRVPGGRKTNLPLGARRVFRLSFCIALSLAIAYALALPLPFLCPIFTLLLTLKPAPPIGFKAMLETLAIVVSSLAVGLLLSPMLVHYPATALVIVACGIYFSSHLILIAGKTLNGTFLTFGITLVSAAGVFDFALSAALIIGLSLALVVAVFCQWMVYFWFPENVAVIDNVKTDKPADKDHKPDDYAQLNWVAIRSILIIMPAYLLLLTNPTAYLAVVVKAISLGRQASTLHARDAGRELMGSTFMGGFFAIVFWFMLDLVTTLWMFVCWMLIFSVYFAGKMYGVFASRYPPSFWFNALITMMILLGPAVADSAGGKDVYAAFAVRMGQMVFVTLYAWLAIYLIEFIRYHRILGKRQAKLSLEAI